MANEAITLLRSIDASLKALLRQQGGTEAAGDVADDRDLDGKYGDPEVKFNPRDWHGDSCKGLRMSECPAGFLDLLAGTFDYFAKQAEKNNETTSSGKAVAPYKRKDAARARGWAARKRAGWKPATMAAGDGDSPWQPSDGFGTSGFEDVTEMDGSGFGTGF